MNESEEKRKPLEDFGRSVGRALGDLDRESERLITYINDEVVPAVRQHSTRALRVAARELERFAEYMEQNQKK